MNEYENVDFDPETEAAILAKIEAREFGSPECDEIIDLSGVTPEDLVLLAATLESVFKRDQE